MKNKTITALAAAAVMALALTACSGQASSGESDDQAGSEIPSASAVETARTSIEAIVENPTPFTVTEELESLPTGARVAIIDCGTPICALMANISQEPVELLGMSATVIQTGHTADSIAAAFDTIIADGYDGVMVTGVQFPLWERQFEQLRDAGVAVATTGIIGLPDDFDAALSAEVWNEHAGSWLADWVVSQGEPAASSVIYRTPELGFTSDIVTAYEQRVAELCDQCAVRVVDLPIATLATTGAQTIVDDLTANPGTSIAVLSIGEQATGLPAAMSVAGIDIPVTMYGAAPAQLTDIVNGDLHSSLTLDSRALVWTLIDTLARQIVGQNVSAGAAGDELITQIVTADNLSGDMSMGWSGYPDMTERFKKLWQIG